MKHYTLKLWLVLILALAFILSFTACGKKGDATLPTGSEVSHSETLADTPQPTEKPRYTEALTDLVDKYTIKLPSFTEMDRETPALSNKIKSPRFKLKKNGWYRNSDAEETGEAILMFTGDLMCQGRQQEAALDKYGEYKFNESFSIVKDIFSQADLVVGNLETTLCAKAPYMSEESKVDDKPHCNAPATYLSALRYAGFDAVVMANNHNCDVGVYGILDTLDNVEDYKLMHTGTFTSENEQPFLLINVNGIKVALMSYATYYNTKDSYLTEEGQNALLNRYSKEAVEKHVGYAKKMGAEFIIAYNHWGIEYTNEENEKQRQTAQEMADAGVDYIIGSHPHALQRYDILTAHDGRQVPVVYSMGNFVSHMTRDISQDTIILKMELTRTENGIAVSDGYIPCRVFITFKGKNYLVMPLSAELNGGRQSHYLVEAYDRITCVMGDKLSVIGSKPE